MDFDVHVMNMGNVLKLLEASLTPFFPSVDSMGNLMELANRLPPLSGAGLECHLSEINSRTDFLLRATSTCGGRESLADCHPLFKLHPSFYEHSEGRRIRDFALDWIDPYSNISKLVNNVWLEFDLYPERHPLRFPSIFFDMNKKRCLDIRESVNLLDRSITLLVGSYSAKTLDNIENCLRSTPGPADLFYFGVMLSRKTNAFRLCLTGFKFFQIQSFLSMLTWPGDLDALGVILDIYAQDTCKIVLDLDVGEEIQPSLGLELFYSNPKEYDEILKVMINNGLCVSNAMDQVIQWPGVLEIPTSKLREGLSIAMKTNIQYLVRRINHLKISIDSFGKVTVKAYLYLCYT